MLTGVLFQGDTTAASLFKVVLLSTPATGGVSASARPLKRDRCSKREPTLADGARPRDYESQRRRLRKSTDFMVLNINVFDDKDTYINRQYYELKNANCNPLTFFKPKMALVASSKNPPAPLVQDYFVCKPSKSAALNIAIGAATGTAGLIGTAALSFMVLVSVFLLRTKHCSKEKVIMFDEWGRQLRTSCTKWLTTSSSNRSSPRTLRRKKRRRPRWKTRRPAVKERASGGKGVDWR